MSAPVVTAVTLSYNQAPFLERALRSVLAQDQPVEYIVVDAGSTDGSRDIVERYRASLAHVVYGPDNGPADGLNKALARASGDIFVCVNADDALMPWAVREAVAAFSRHPRAAAVYASGVLADDRGRTIRRFRSTQFDLWRFACGAVNVMHQSTFVRLDAFRDVGGFNSENRTSWDGELLADLALAGHELVRVRGLWGVFTLHPGSISMSSTLDEQYVRDRERLFAKVAGRPPRLRDWVHFIPARTMKWLADPPYLAWRLADAVRPPRVMELP
jgi:glycosyltransferase involved in cell wall biosynthesis